MFYLMTHSTHFINGYMASDIWLRTIVIVRKETRCHHIGYSFQLTARVLLYAPSNRQDSTYHSLCVTPVAEHWLEREIAQWVHYEGLTRTTHRTMSERPYHRATSPSPQGRKQFNNALNTCSLLVGFLHLYCVRYNYGKGTTQIIHEETAADTSWATLSD